MGRLLEPPVAAVLGAVVGALLTVALAASGVADHADPVDAGEVRRAFVSAWERSRTSTFAAAGEFVREASGGRRFASAVTIVQRPPDRLVTGAGSVSGRLDGHRVACSTDEDGTLGCRTGEAVGPYDEAVAGEVAAVRAAVAPGGAYAVMPVEDPGASRTCFGLRRRSVAPATAPPWGRRARFCFDRATGAPVETVIRRPESIDRTLFTTVTPDVTDGDLELPVDPAP